MKCQHCGSDVEGKFCGNCGAPAPAPAQPQGGISLPNVNQQQAQMSQPTQPPIPPQQPPIPPQQFQPQYQGNMVMGKAPSRGMKGWQVALIVIGVLVALLFGVLFIGGLLKEDKLISTQTSSIAQKAPVAPKKQQDNAASKDDAVVPPADSADDTAPSDDTTDGEEVDLAKDIEVTKLSYNHKYGDYAVVVLKNNTGKTVDINADISFKDATGKLVGVDLGSEEAIPTGAETYIAVSNDTPFTDYDYELEVSETQYYLPVIQDLTYETSQVENKVIVTVTNNGSKIAEYVEAKALFFSGGKLVYIDDAYTVDNESELRPGKSKSGELRCDEAFDEVKIYMAGRCDEDK